MEEMALVRCAGKHSEAGIAPDDTMPGDVIALLSGVSLPMVLRPVNGGFEIVGPAFFRNVMSGDLWTAVNMQERIRLLWSNQLCWPGGKKESHSSIISFTGLIW